MEIHELWDEPWEGLPEEESAWEWDPVSEEENGVTKNPPDGKPGWKRWYFILHQPVCTNVKISADRDPARENGSTPTALPGAFDMVRRTVRPDRISTERAALRRRIRQMYAALNRGDWAACYELIDPRLRDKGAIDLPRYAASLDMFKRAFGSVNPWYVRLSLHLPPHKNKQDPRAFAYVYVVWQDERRAFHMFRERWVKDGDRWHTRVVGLVTHATHAGAAEATV
jgi:hypothetical protein